jgi:hypothetical protein
VLAGAFKKLGVIAGFGESKRLGTNLTLRNETAELFTPFEQIFGFKAVQRRPIERRLDDFLVGERDVEAAAKLAQLPLV